jgi:hypothetical protein
MMGNAHNRNKKIFPFLNSSHFRVEHIPSPGQLDGGDRSVDPA